MLDATTIRLDEGTWSMTHASIPTVATPPARSRLSMPFRLLVRPWLLLRVAAPNGTGIRGAMHQRAYHHSRDVLAQGRNRLLSRGSVDPRHTHGGRERRACHAWLAMCGEQDSAANVSLAIGRNSIGADLLMARAMPVCAPGGANELVSYGKIGSWVEMGFILTHLFTLRFERTSP
jgi:hypothetical protein